MKVIAEEAWSWMLLNQGEDFLLSVVCGSVGLFERHIQLNEEEKILYRLRSTGYIANLAEEIRRHPESFSSRYIAGFDDLPGIGEAIQAWVAARPLTQ
jgi:hypothetical protein